MTHVRTSPYYPQSNGKIERWHKTLKGECVRPGTPLTLEDARRIVARYVERYNTVRLHSAIGYVTPQDKLLGRDPEIFAARDRKLALARDRRAVARQTARPAPLASTAGAPTTTSTWAEDRAPVGTDPSADPGAKTAGGGTMPPHLPCGIGTNAINPPVPYDSLVAQRGTSSSG